MIAGVSRGLFGGVFAGVFGGVLALGVSLAFAGPGVTSGGSSGASSGVSSGFPQDASPDLPAAGRGAPEAGKPGSGGAGSGASGSGQSGREAAAEESGAEKSGAEGSGEGSGEDPGTVVLSGVRASRGGAVECPRLRDDAGVLHPVSYLPPWIALGDRVTVRGRLAVTTTCRGVVLVVDELVKGAR